MGGWVVFDSVRSAFHPADPIAAMAWDSVQTLSWSISAKTRRAVHQIVDERLDQDWDDRALDPRGVQSDGNGSAKVTRLMVRESGEGWVVLSRSDQVLAPFASEMIGHLDALDAELVRAFPHAMEFQRPGFDE